MEELVKVISKLEDVTKIQTSDGNWNYDPYMQGMANGLILALSIAKGDDPVFLEAPEVWLKDKPNDKKPTSVVPETEDIINKELDGI